MSMCVSTAQARTDWSRDGGHVESCRFTSAPCSVFEPCSFRVAGVGHQGHLEVWNMVLCGRHRTSGTFSFAWHAWDILRVAKTFWNLLLQHPYPVWERCSPGVFAAVRDNGRDMWHPWHPARSPSVRAWPCSSGLVVSLCFVCLVSLVLSSYFVRASGIYASSLAGFVHFKSASRECCCAVSASCTYCAANAVGNRNFNTPNLFHLLLRSLISAPCYLSCFVLVALC